MKNILLLLISTILVLPSTTAAQTPPSQYSKLSPHIKPQTSAPFDLDRQTAKYQSTDKQKEVNIPMVKNAIEIEKSIGKLVKLVGTYRGDSRILSYKESSSGGTFIVLQASIFTSDNSQIHVYSQEPMLGQFMRSSDEIKKYHEREVVVTGEIKKEGNHYSIIPEKIERLSSSPFSLSIDNKAIISHLGSKHSY